MADNIFFNEAVLERIARDPLGPVGQRLRVVAENVALDYEYNVARYLPAFVQQGGSIGFDIVSDDLGLVAVIGIDPGHGSDRFAEAVGKKILKEPEKATDALDQGLHA